MDSLRRSFPHPLESTNLPDIPRPAAWEFLGGSSVRWWGKDRPRREFIERLVAWGSRSPRPPRIMKAGFSRPPCPAMGRTGGTGRGPPFRLLKLWAFYGPKRKRSLLAPSGQEAITGETASSGLDC